MYIIQDTHKKDYAKNYINFSEGLRKNLSHGIPNCVNKIYLELSENVHIQNFIHIGH